jgi:hypothetical protein
VRKSNRKIEQAKKKHNKHKKESMNMHCSKGVGGRKEEG